MRAPASEMLPFAAIAIIGQLIAFLNPVPLAPVDLWSSTALLVIVLAGFCALRGRTRSTGAFVFLITYVASVALLMLAEGGAATGSGTLFLVPVVAAALFLGFRDAISVTVAALIAILAIGLVVHSADGELVRRLILWSAICVLIVVPIRRLRSHLQSSLIEARRLLHNSQTLELAARELSSLRTEHEILAAAARLAAMVASPPAVTTPRGAHLCVGADGAVVAHTFPVDEDMGTSWIPAEVSSLLSQRHSRPIVFSTEVRSAAPDDAHAPSSTSSAWMTIAPEGQPHGLLGFANEGATASQECLSQLAALSQLVEMSLSNVFAHKRLEQQATLEERRRIARDLHDGLAHELTFIATRARSKARTTSDAGDGELARSADRALDEARRAITVLSADRHQFLSESLAQTAEDLGDRYGVDIRLDVARDLDVFPGVGEHLLRITREAICNAVRHGQPETLTVRLWRDDAIHLVVEDDGIGFDVDATTRGFGLISMTERAEAIGGALCVRSTPTTGTRVEVRVP